MIKRNFAEERRNVEIQW